MPCCTCKSYSVMCHMCLHSVAVDPLIAYLCPYFIHCPSVSWLIGVSPASHPAVCVCMHVSMYVCMCV